MNHTPEPWNFGGVCEIYKDNILIADFGYDDVPEKMNLELLQSNAKRAVECVNAMQGKTNPIQWMNEAHEILLKVFEFEHHEMKLGESKIDFMLRFIKQHTV